MGRTRRRAGRIVGVAIALAAIGGGAGIAIASSGDDDRPLTGADLDKATAAALAHTGGGTVVETEVGDGGAAFGVEVRLDEGTVVEVGLDENFEVIGQEADVDGRGDDTRTEDD